MATADGKRWRRSGQGDVDTREASIPEAVVVEVLDRLVDVGVDGIGPLDSAIEVAEAALALEASSEQAITRVIADHVKLAAAEGFVTGLGGFITLPVALPANVAAYQVLATRMVAAIAHIRGHDVTQESTQTAILFLLSGDDAPEVLKRAGVTPRLSSLTTAALKDLPPGVLAAVNKAIAFRMLVQVGEKGLARFGRFVPGVGGVLGGGVDAWMIRKLGIRAREELPIDATTRRA
ncbi:EcsC family protein [Euzebya tangerina]|uniref:EcsC family protein n=1 Tax=Euzebya tangerina TaxID=591198 RepID=UPI0013C2A7CE|nr:EcsC family protein [Euzebya tangerina]